MWRHLLGLTIAIAASCNVYAAALQNQQPEPREQERTPGEAVPSFAELVIVTASRAQEDLLSAPAAVTVIAADAIATSPAHNVADLLRSVPGLNLIQTSARDFNMTSRSATRTTANTQLVLVDGRSVYQDFLGFVLWDGLSIDPGDVKQIEVVRGPASAIWGANAMDGVVNIITKSPRELAGSSFSIGAGTFDRHTASSNQGLGGLFYARGTHAAVVNDRWAYKLSAGFNAQDALPRPTGFIPNAFHTAYPSFSNSGTSEPKVDARVDYEVPQSDRRLTFAGGVSGVDGIMHTGSGPFQIQRGSRVGYGKVGFSADKLQLNAFVNFVDGEAVSLLSRDATGQPIPFGFESETFDVEFSHERILGRHHLLRYGGNARASLFDLTVAPEGKNRKEGGAYLQDRIFLNTRVQWVVGGRLDKLGVIDHLVFSPRTALIVTPHPRHALRFSVNRAFRSPTLINNYLDLNLITDIDLGLIDPALAGRRFAFPVAAVGNRDLREESMTTVEVGHTALLGRKTILGAAYYVNNKRNNILFSQVASYVSSNPPPDWPLPPVVLDLLIGSGAGLPSRLMDINVGKVREQGLELSVESGIHPAVTVTANYSWQKEPSAEAATLGAINLPAHHRVNAGVTFDQPRYFATLSTSHVGSALWRDVLDSRFHGPTSAFTQLDAGGGMRWAQGRTVLSVKVTNLANRAIQHHVFGDIVKRQASVELRMHL